MHFFQKIFYQAFRVLMSFADTGSFQIYFRMCLKIIGDLVMKGKRLFIHRAEIYPLRTAHIRQRVLIILMLDKYCALCAIPKHIVVIGLVPLIYFYKIRSHLIFLELRHAILAVTVLSQIGYDGGVESQARGGNSRIRGVTHGRYDEYVFVLDFLRERNGYLVAGRIRLTYDFRL